MKTLYKILIVVFIIIIIVVISVVLYLFLGKKPEQKEENKKLAKKPSSMSIYDYNNLYNMNYESKNITNKETINMDSALATVITTPVKKIINVNNKKLTLYIANVKYDIKNYFNKDIGSINAFTMFTQPNNKLPPYKSTIKLDKENNIPSKNLIPTTAEIVTTKEINKDDKFIVYYKYGSDIYDRVAPPFLIDTYVTYL